MALAKIFPDFDTIRSPIDGIPNQWQELLSLDAAEAASVVCRYSGVRSDCDVSRILATAEDFGLLVPKRKRDRDIHRLWRIAFQTTTDLAMYFTPPETVIGDRYPEDYSLLLSEVGACHFTQYGGHILTPNQVVRVSRELDELILSDGSPLESFTPFFDHETGDFDCWRGENRLESYYFDHETNDLSLYCDLGFAEWFEKRFISYLNM